MAEGQKLVRTSKNKRKTPANGQAELPSTSQADQLQAKVKKLRANWQAAQSELNDLEAKLREEAEKRTAQAKDDLEAASLALEEAKRALLDQLAKEGLIPTPKGRRAGGSGRRGKAPSDPEAANKILDALMPGAWRSKGLITKAVGLTNAQWASAIKSLRAEGKVKVRGDRRSAEYAKA